jgi:O-antigen/teichoic acid export membrane protein
VTRSQTQPPPSTAGLAARLARSLGAGVVGQVITAGIQFASVPLLLAAWGTQGYGEWLILSAVPAYLAMSDIGFATAAGNDMTMKAARGDSDGVLTSYQSVWLLTTAASLVVGAGALAAARFAPLAALGLQQTPEREARATLAILALYVVVGLQSSVLGTAFRAAGHYAAGLMLANAQRLLEFGAMVAAALLGCSMHLVALAYLAARFGSLLLTWAWLRRLSPWLELGVRHARLSRIRELALPAVSFLGFPLGNALGLQGALSVVGALLGPSAVPVFATHRTLVNAVQSIMGVLNSSVWPEFSLAYGGGEIALARKLHRLVCQISLWAALAAGAALAVSGKLILAVWTRGRIPFDVLLFGALLAAMLVRTLWFTSSVVPAAINRHNGIAAWYVGGSALALALSALWVRQVGLWSVGAALAAGDLLLAVVVTRRSLALLDDSLDNFILEMARPPSPRALLRVLRR